MTASVSCTVVEGESNISKSRERIQNVYFDPPFAAPLEEVIAAIREADAIVLGPGSLFTSILPNFLVDRIAREVSTAPGVKIYVCNVMTQPGETDSLTASEHVEALLRCANERVCDYVIVNEQLPSKLLAQYAEEGQTPVLPDLERIESLGMTAISANVISETVNVRHDSDRLANVVLGVLDKSIAQRATYVKGVSNERARLLNP